MFYRRMYLPSWKHLERESSPVDWCEENYTFSPYIGRSGKIPP
jgi:hypothetical protein